LWGCDLTEPSRSTTTPESISRRLDTQASTTDQALADHRNVDHVISSSKKQKDVKRSEKESEHSTTNKKTLRGDSSTGFAESPINSSSVPNVAMLVEISEYSGQVVIFLQAL
jgi:hypothetical protein